MAARRVDNYIDMGCFRNPELVRPALLEGFEMGYREAQQQIITDFRGDELDAVMTSVDKWLTGDELKNNPATRAADAREVALKAIEAEAARAEATLRDVWTKLYDLRGEPDKLSAIIMREHAAIMGGNDGEARAPLMLRNRTADTEKQTGGKNADNRTEGRRLGPVEESLGKGAR